MLHAYHLDLYPGVPVLKTDAAGRVINERNPLNFTVSVEARKDRGKLKSLTASLKLPNSTKERPFNN